MDQDIIGKETKCPHCGHRQIIQAVKFYKYGRTSNCIACKKKIVFVKYFVDNNTRDTTKEFRSPKRRKGYRHETKR